MRVPAVAFLTPLLALIVGCAGPVGDQPVAGSKIKFNLIVASPLDVAAAGRFAALALACVQKEYPNWAASRRIWSPGRERAG